MTCPICQQTKNYLINKREFPKHHICKNCGFVYMYPLPDTKHLNSYYEEDYWKTHHSTKGLINKIDSNSFDSRNKAIYEWCKPYIKDSQTKVLEIGAGFGHTLAYINLMSKCKVEGIEPSKEGAYNAMHSYGIDTFNGFLEDFKTDSKFDIIILSHVFEHFYNPDTAMQVISNLMKDGGILFIEVPNVLFPNPKKHKLGWFSKEHISYFSRNKLNYFLVKHGFKMLRSEETTYLRTISVKGKTQIPKWRNEYLRVRCAIFIHDMLYYKMRLLQKLKIQK